MTEPAMTEPTMTEPIPATNPATDQDATPVAPITADELVARGCRRIVAFSLEPPPKPSRQQRHRMNRMAEDGLRQLNFDAADDESIRACLRGLGKASLRPEVASALLVLGEQQDDAASLAILARLADPEFRAAVAAISTGGEIATGGEGADGLTPDANEPPPARPCEARVLRRIGALPDDQVEAVAVAASPKDHRIRALALQSRSDPRLLSDTHALAKLEPERRRSLLALDEATLHTAQTITGSPEMAAVMRALSRDKRLLRQAKALIGTDRRVRPPKAGDAYAHAGKNAAPRSWREGWRGRWLTSWLRRG